MASMKDLLEHLIKEDDFEDAFEPASSKERKRRRLVRIQHFADDPELKKYIKSSWLKHQDAIFLAIKNKEVDDICLELADRVLTKSTAQHHEVASRSKKLEKYMFLSTANERADVIEYILSADWAFKTLVSARLGNNALKKYVHSDLRSMK